MVAVTEKERYQEAAVGILMSTKLNRRKITWREVAAVLADDAHPMLESYLGIPRGSLQGIEKVEVTKRLYDNAQKTLQQVMQDRKMDPTGIPALLRTPAPGK